MRTVAEAAREVAERLRSMALGPCTGTGRYGHCVTCRWAVPFDDQGEPIEGCDLECHRRPPTCARLTDGDGEVLCFTDFPAVGAFEWCGEYEEEDA